MLGKWDHSRPMVYGSEASYRKAAEFLDGYCPIVEDWGAGRTAAKPYFVKSRYIAIDGSVCGDRIDMIADLRDYRSEIADGILIRHVLEHNYDWTRIVQNALGCPCLRRLVIVLFLQPRDWTEMFELNQDGIPNLHISRRCLEEMFQGWSWRSEMIPRNDLTCHTAEYFYFAERRA